ncbi:SAM-dependent methyltransferase [Streptomyces jumonjinensis]|uniref:Class I SAM-dependent methyltransferase n=1 Tax=Streptomyces jumonjinensis TaxID=1945 RepID=A0A646KLK0_STRJU|nr:class I SAM-dependent methyltransferase [Streptomyces jumonjinensis]MQT03199.1 class I SAM-dependent methyltransferase [Streptomyces jumonjinensis]
MNRQMISAVAHGDHPIAAPLADDSVARLLDRALPRGDERLLDLGCGQGAWLERAVRGRPGLRAEGVDIDAAALDRATERFAREGLGGQILLHAGNAREFTPADRFDLVLCVGATHAFGGLLPTLEAARAHLAPGGSVLIGEGFWEREPDERTLEAGFGADEYAGLAGTVDKVTADGWTPVYAHVSSLAEWDDYEWSWTGTLAGWGLDRAGEPDGAAALEAAAAHRDAWLHGYRGTLGFVTLLLRQTPR